LLLEAALNVMPPQLALALLLSAMRQAENVLLSLPMFTTTL